MNKLRNKFDNLKRIVLSLTLFSMLSINVFSQETDTHIDNCKKYMMEQKYSEALEECQILFQSNLDSTNTGLIYAFAGIAYKELGEADKALEHLKTSIQYKVPRYDIYEMFIALANEQNDDDKYEFGLLEETKAFPDLAYIVDPKLLNHYLKTKNYEKLVEYSNKCLESNPKEVSYLYYSAFGYQNLNQLDKAESYYLSVLEIDPNHTNANLSLGNLYYKNATTEYNSQKEKYEKIKNPSRMDYDQYRKSLSASKAIYQKALPYMLKVYNEKPSDNLKGIIYNIYSRLGEKETALKYK